MALFWRFDIRRTYSRNSRMSWTSNIGMPLMIMMISAVVRAADQSFRISLRQVTIPNESRIQKLIAEIRRRATDAELNQCYESAFGDRSIDLFVEKDFKDVLSRYLRITFKGSYNDKKNNAEEQVKIRSQAMARNLEWILNQVLKCLTVPETERTKYGITSLSMLTPQEYRKMLNPGFMRRRHQLFSTSSSQCNVPVVENLPVRFDWRDQGKVTEVKNQGTCGSCFIFGATGTVESAYLISHPRLRPENATFSEQATLNCLNDPDVCDRGGMPDDVFQFQTKIGVIRQSEAPYWGKKGRCGRYHILFRLKSFCDRQLADDHQMMSIIYRYGPVVVGVEATESGWPNAIDIYDGPCGTDPNHAVMVVGWDDKYWIIKNSWGRDWGRQGYLRLPRGQNKCGINTLLARPILY